MAYEPEWQGYASLAESGVREALFAAGVDCAMSACREPECMPAHELDRSTDGQPTC
ncbi:hypothetical protein [Pseudoxanthomonas yeongjuensis]|jgi:hypothetical protein|uniref:hypothetical protein n=1 Tax=Pseudoxanthomonas yeongjuensis TaxID=377616 RepID=UPI0013918FEB|nr:hypothetical protein [Pseudoxanthomonas yeongjuensis]